MTQARPAVSYTRVSSAEQLREGFSVGAQDAANRDYAARNGFEIVAHFSDDETAKSTGRSDFARMLAHLRKHPEHALLVEKVDRLYRNPKDYITLDDLKVEIHFVKEGGRDRRDSDGRFMHWIRVGMARKYVENLSEEVRKGMTRKCEEGGWPTWAPLGYLNAKDASGKAVLIVDPTKAPLVRELFEAAARGAGLADLTRLADRIGLRGRHGTTITKPTLAYIIQNEAYTGWFEWGGKRYHGNHEPLISSDLYARVQRTLSGGSRPKARTHVFTYSGLARCGVCEGLLTGDAKKGGRFVYYSCRGSLGCKRFYRERDLDAAVIERLRALTVRREVSDGIAGELARWYDDATGRESSRVSRIQARMAQLDHMAAASYEEKLLGVVSEATWREASVRWSAEQTALREELATLQPMIGKAEFLRRARSPFELAERAPDQYLTWTPEERGALLKTCCSNFLVTDGNISIVMRSPFDVLMKIAGSPDWLTTLDDVRTYATAILRSAA